MALVCRVCEGLCISHRGPFKVNFSAIYDERDIWKLFEVEMIPDTLLTDTLNLNARSSRDNPCLSLAKAISNSLFTDKALFYPGFV